MCPGQMLGGAWWQKPGIWGCTGTKGEEVAASRGLWAHFPRLEGLVNVEGSPPGLLREGEVKSKVGSEFVGM